MRNPWFLDGFQWETIGIHRFFDWFHWKTIGNHCFFMVSHVHPSKKPMDSYGFSWKSIQKTKGLSLKSIQKTMVSHGFHWIHQKNNGFLQFLIEIHIKNQWFPMAFHWNPSKKTMVYFGFSLNCFGFPIEINPKTNGYPWCSIEIHTRTNGVLWLITHGNPSKNKWFPIISHWNQYQKPMVSYVFFEIHQKTNGIISVNAMVSCGLSLKPIQKQMVPYGCPLKSIATTNSFFPMVSIKKEMVSYSSPWESISHRKPLFFLMGCF